MNTWFWKSEEEFKRKVRPLEHASIAATSNHHSDNFSVHVRDFIEALEQLQEANSSLEEILASNGKIRAIQEDKFSDVMDHVIRLVLNGEYLQALCRPLADTEAAIRFNDRKEVSERLPQLQEQGFSVPKLRDLLDKAKALLDAAHDFLHQKKNLVALVPELPDDLKSDFICAEHLSSIGFDEAALIYCGRALEGVVRRIATNHEIMSQPVERARFFEILKELEKKRVSSDNSLVVDEQTRHLLHYSRTIRNQSAHPAHAEEAGMYQEKCKLMAGTADRLWRKCSAPGVQIV